MAIDGPEEIIVVRSLTDSDLGIFAAHRAAARSKQRAININSPIAERILSPALFSAGGTYLECTCVYHGIFDRSRRHFGKVGKNWRLGGNKIDGREFAELDSRDFLLLRTIAGNDGSFPVHISFVGRTADRVAHAGIAAIVEKALDRSMAVWAQGTDTFEALSRQMGDHQASAKASTPIDLKATRTNIPPMPSEPTRVNGRKRTVRDKVRSPHMLEQMLRVSGDLSAPAQLRFWDTVEQLASQLRQVLLETGGIIKIQKDHRSLWSSVAGKQIGFIDGGLANLSMLGSAPMAARVGGYVVRPGDYSDDREHFIMLKHLIDELYDSPNGGIYTDSFPDLGALRDAARISIEFAGAVKALGDFPDIAWVFMHGALVNPVSRYTDEMRDGHVLHAFPNFSPAALRNLLPPEEPLREGREANFIAVHLRQLQILNTSSAIVCGVIERPATTSSVCHAVLSDLDDDAIHSLLPVPPAEWKKWFRHSINPADAHEGEGQRITDSLLFRCVLEPGEALAPIIIDRNDERRAPKAWWDTHIKHYPQPLVSYVQPTEWNAPIRIEMFVKDRQHFQDTAALVLHSALLLPQYAFPVGLDIVDKFARVPNWMSRPVNNHTAVQALKRALDSGDTRLFDALRRMLCGSKREWLLRPGTNA